LTGCSECLEKESAYGAWTCLHCEDASYEKLSPALMRALLWLRVKKAGHPVSGAGFWEMWLMSLIEEMEDERRLRHE